MSSSPYGIFGSSLDCQFHPIFAWLRPISAGVYPLCTGVHPNPMYIHPIRVYAHYKSDVNLSVLPPPHMAEEPWNIRKNPKSKLYLLCLM